MASDGFWSMFSSEAWISGWINDLSTKGTEENNDLLTIGSDDVPFQLGDF